MYRIPLPDERTAAHLAAIEREQRLLEAEIALVDAEIRFLTAEPAPTQLDWRRLRRARGIQSSAIAWAAGPPRPQRPRGGTCTRELCARRA